MIEAVFELLSCAHNVDSNGEQMNQRSRAGSTRRRRGSRGGAGRQAGRSGRRDARDAGRWRGEEEKNIHSFHQPLNKLLGFFGTSWRGFCTLGWKPF